MNEHVASGAFFFAPFVSSTRRVDPAWIDHNGHMNLAYYHVLFDHGVDEACLMIGIGPEYVATRKSGLFAAEAHVHYRRELLVTMPVRATVQLVDYDDKRLHLWTELRHAEEGWLSATCETMLLHVDLGTRKVSTFPADIIANIATMKAAHSGLPRPEGLGRVMRMPPRARPGRPGIH